MNDNIDVRRLVGLLSYLKKHDDVEQEIRKVRAGRRVPVDQRKSTPAEQALTGQEFTSDPPGSFVPPGSIPGRRGYSTAGGGSVGAYQIDESPSQPGLPSSVPPSSTQEIQGPSVPITPYKDYYPQGGELGPRGGHFDTLGDTPVESVTAPDPMQEDDTSDDATDDERDLVQWFRDEGYTLAELKQMIEDFTAPATSSPKIKSPQDYKRHSVFQRSAIFTKSRPKIVRKFNESNILNLFNRLGI